MGGFSPVPRQQAWPREQADEAVSSNSIQQKIQQICDPSMMRLSFSRVDFLGQTYSHAEVAPSRAGGAQQHS